MKQKHKHEWEESGSVSDPDVKITLFKCLGCKLKKTRTQRGKKVKEVVR